LAQSRTAVFAVFSLDGIGDIELGDILSGCFDDSDGLFKSVHNDSQRKQVHISAETWQCSRKVALEFLGRLNSPTKIWTL